MHPLIQDLSFSFRSLRKSSGFTVVVVLTLTLGIAGTTVIFAVINATVLRPLPYPEPDRLVILHWQDQSDISARAFFTVRNQAHSFSLLSASYPAYVGVNISDTGSPEYVKALSVSSDFFSTLGVHPESGSQFSAEDGQPHSPCTTLLSHALWTAMFNHEHSVLGRDLLVNGQRCKIIGIMPHGFQTYPEADIWLPLQLNAGTEDPGSNYRVIGRLASGVSRQQAQNELESLARQHQLNYLPSARPGTLVTEDLHSFVADKVRTVLAVLFSAVIFLFLVACSNVAVLILVRRAAEAPAITIRAALGASRMRLAFSLFAESLLLSLAGGLLGLILTKESFPLLLWLWPRNVSVPAQLSTDSRVVLFAFAMSILSPLLFGSVPALKLSRLNIAEVLAHTSCTTTSSMEQVQTIRLLVFSQMTLTIMLLTGTMLLVRSLANLYSVPLGFDPPGLVVAQISLADDRYNSTHSAYQLLNEVTTQLRQLSGVDGVAVVNGLPLENGLNLPLHPLAMPHSVDHADEYRPVTPDYFRIMGIHLRTGRSFGEDTAGSAPVAIVNETLARRWWPDTSPIGQYLRVDEELGPQPADAPRQIVGVVSDIHEKGPGLPPPPTIFVPLSQTPDNINAFFNKAFLTSIVLRTSGSIDLSNQVRSAVQSVDPHLPLATFRPFSQVVNQSLANSRFIAYLTTAFSIFALVLSAVGIHGLFDYQARLRYREIAIRMVVGASRTHVVRSIVRQCAQLIFLAFLASLAGSFIIKSLLSGLLYNVGTSALVAIGTGLLLGSVAMLISLLVAFRAACIAPTAVLRNE